MGVNILLALNLADGLGPKYIKPFLLESKYINKILPKQYHCFSEKNQCNRIFFNNLQCYLFLVNHYNLLIITRTELEKII